MEVASATTFAIKRSDNSSLNLYTEQEVKQGLNSSNGGSITEEWLGQLSIFLLLGVGEEKEGDEKLSDVKSNTNAPMTDSDTRIYTVIDKEGDYENDYA